jgi:hypothetical protein
VAIICGIPPIPAKGSNACGVAGAAAGALGSGDGAARGGEYIAASPQAQSSTLSGSKRICTCSPMRGTRSAGTHLVFSISRPRADPESICTRTFTRAKAPSSRRLPVSST